MLIQWEDQRVTMSDNSGNLRPCCLYEPSGHPNRSYSLINLGAVSSTRFEKLNTTEDLREAVDLLQSRAQDVTSTHKRRYTCTSRLISLLEKHN